jgi:galactitol-specific phosphotransferase system IIC component
MVQFCARNILLIGRLVRSIVVGIVLIEWSIKIMQFAVIGPSFTEMCTNPENDAILFAQNRSIGALDRGRASVHQIVDQIYEDCRERSVVYRNVQKSAK